MLENQCGKVSIFTKMEKIFFVERIDFNIAVFQHDDIRDEECLIFTYRPNAVHTKAPRQACYGPEQGFKSFG
jgi:hypothetical protein